MPAAERLRLHAVVPRSRANGPGERAVVWVQGCTLACPGCFNPETHRRGGEEVATDTLVAELAALGDAALGDPIEGVTISGGEPLQQRRAVVDLLARLRAGTNLSTLMFTGYRFDEVERMAELPVLREYLDVLVAGRYERDRPVGRGLLGSANQTVHLFSDRYSVAALDDVPVSEVLISPGGEITVTGVDPPTFPEP